MLNLLAYLAPTSFSFGEGACSSPPLRKNDGRIPPEQTCCYVLLLAAARYENPLKLAALLAQMARYAFMIIVSDNHAYRSLTPFSPVIRGYICLSCFLATTTGLVGSAPPFGRSCPNKPLPRPPPLKAVMSFFVGWRFARGLSTPEFRARYAYLASSPPLRGLSDKHRPMGAASPTSPYPDHHP